MRDSGVGRVLVASLHEAIADVLPTRLTFYESWLTPEGLRDGTIGLAPLYAVLSFLRQEGAAYARVTAAAGTYAADWTVASMPAMRRNWIRMLPRPLRRRAVLRRAAAVVRDSYAGNTMKWRVRRGVARVRVRGSVFCEVREPVPQPLCTFFAAIIEEMARQYALPVAVSISSCRAARSELCEMQVTFGVETTDAEADSVETTTEEEHA